MYSYSHSRVESDLQHSLDLGRDVGLLVQLDALLVGAARALHGDALQMGQHHAVRLRHRLELVKKEFQQLQQKPAVGRQRVIKTRQPAWWTES